MGRESSDVVRFDLGPKSRSSEDSETQKCLKLAFLLQKYPSLILTIACVGGSKHARPNENIFERNILVGT